MTSRELPQRQREWSTQTHLVLLVVVLLVPILVFAGVLLQRYFQSERLRFEREALELARRITAAVDREIVGVQTALQTLATSRVLDPGNPAEFYRQASEVKPLLGAEIVYRDSTGQQVVNTRLPLGADLPRVLTDGDRQALQSRAPHVSDLFVGVTAKHPIVAISVPVVRGDQVVGVLSAALEPERLSARLRDQGLPSDWTAALVDRNGVIVARSRFSSRYVGSKATEDLRNNAAGWEGTWMGSTLEGAPVLSAYVRSGVSQWRAAVGLPLASVQKPLLEAVQYLIMFGLVALAVSAALAAMLARRMAEPMRRLADAAADAGRGVVPAPIRSSVREVNRAAEALRESAAELAAREGERQMNSIALSEAKQRLERVLNTSPIGIIEFDAVGRVVFANVAAELIVGVRRGGLNGETADNNAWRVRRLDGTPVPAPELPVSKALQGQAVYDAELTLESVLAPQQRAVTSINAVPIFDREGRATGALVTLVDLTERHKAEEALRASESRFRAAVRAMSGVLWTNSAEGRMEGEQPGWAALTGQTLSEYQGFGWSQAVHPEDAEPTVQAWRRAVAEKRSFVFEHRVKRADGQWRLFAVRAVPIFDAAGGLREWVGVHHDVTDQRLAAETKAWMLDLGDRLRDISDPLDVMAIASDMLRRRLDVARVGYAEIDPQADTITIACDQCREGIGSLMGRHALTEFGAELIDEMRSGEVLIVEDVAADPRLRAGRDAVAFAQIEVRATIAVPLIKDGELRAALLVHDATPREWTEAEIAFAQDVAERTWAAVERARAENALRAFTEKLEAEVALRTQDLTNANRRLRAEVAERERVQEQLRQSQKMEALGQLTGGIAHDFNNLLAVIIGNLQLCGRRVERGEVEAVERLVEHAMEGATRAAGLTQRLLAFSRQQPLRPEPLDPNRLVARMSDLLNRTLGEQIRVETVLAAGLWRAAADPNQLESALLNLAVNARDAMKGGGRLTIETANAFLDDAYAQEHPGTQAGQYVMLAVTDTGEGMTPEVTRRAFEPFFTTKPAGQGTGLGLSQVYGFVRQSGGHVKIYSEPGQGTTVKLYMPRYFGPETGEADAPVAAAEGGSEAVLVVEDDDAVRRMSVEALSELGYRVFSAEGAAAALAILEREPDIKLLFTDVVMPEVNGRELAERALQRREGLRVLFTTGYTRNAVVHNGVLDPGVHLLIKPFTVDQLAAKVREVLESPPVVLA